MQEAFMEIIPPQLVEFCALGKFTDGKLTIIVGNGAVAAKLKQILPSLLSKFHTSGYVEVTSIQITVQANYYICHAVNLTREKPEISQAGGAESSALVETTMSVPSSPMTDTAHGIAKTVAGRGEGNAPGRGPRS